MSFYYSFCFYFVRYKVTWTFLGTWWRAARFHILDYDTAVIERKKFVYQALLNRRSMIDPERWQYWENTIFRHDVVAIDYWWTYRTIFTIVSNSLDYLIIHKHDVFTFLCWKCTCSSWSLMLHCMILYILYNTIIIIWKVTSNLSRGSFARSCSSTTNFA